MVLAIGVLFFAAYLGWVSWLILLWIAALPFMSLLLSLPGMLPVKLAADVPARMNRWENARAYLVASGGRLPIPPRRAVIRLTCLQSGEKTLLKEGDPLPTGHCGGFLAEPAKARVYDCLGLMGIRPKTEKRTMLVLPRPEPPAVLPDVSRYLAAAWIPKAGGGYAENHEIRPYRSGDSMNQVHWKLSAKTGQLMLREPMEPRRSRMLVTLDLSADPDRRDRELGEFLWVGRYLLGRFLPFEAAALTGNGLELTEIETEEQLLLALEELLRAPAVREGSVRDRSFGVSWQYDIGGPADET